MRRPKGLVAVVIACAAVWVHGGVGGETRAQPGRFIAIFVIDGLRPDSINSTDTPTLARLRSEGVEYLNSHSIFPTVTRVNAASLATGTYPMLHGIVGNSMYVESVNASAPFDTGDYTQLLKLEEASGRAVTAETLAEALARGGRRLVTLSSGSTGNGYLLNPAGRRGAGVVIHGLFDRGVTAAYPKEISDRVIQQFGSPPPDPDDLGQMRWTDDVLREYVLTELRPDVVIDWMGPLDSAQHAHGVESPPSKAALREIDRSLSLTMERIAALGLTSRTTVIVTSDHGFAHHPVGVDVVGRLVDGGFKASRNSTDVIVASQSQSVFLYLRGPSISRLDALVRFLQQEPWADVIFTRGGANGQGGVPGTFSLDVTRGAHPSHAPDVVVSLPWQSAANAYGAPGSQTIAAQRSGPIDGHASGHGGLSPWVVGNTFVVWGTSLPGGRKTELPVSLADIAPTVLTIMGIKPEPGHGRGRVLTEIVEPAIGALDAPARRRELVTERGGFGAALTVSSVGAHDYIDAGSRRR